MIVITQIITDSTQIEISQMMVTRFLKSFVDCSLLIDL